MSSENEYINLKKNRSVCRGFLVTNTENQIKTLLQNFNMNNDEHEAKLEGLTLTWVGFLGVRFLSWVAVGVKLPSPSLKLVRIMLETCNLVRNCRYICSFRKYTFMYQNVPKIPLILLMPAFLLQKFIIFWQN